MPPISRAEFADLFGALPPAAARAFVADLYAARGWETRVEDGLVVAERDGAVRRLAPPGAPGGEDGVETLTTEEVHELALFAVDRETCESLFESYFDRPLPAPTAGPDWTVDPPRTASAGDAQQSGADAGGGRERTLAAAVLAVLLLCVAGVAGYAAVGGLGGVAGAGAAGDVPDGSGPPPTATATPGGGAGPPSLASRENVEGVGPIDGNAPPGLNESGITDAEALAAAHADAVRNASYTWSISTEELADGDSGARDELVIVEGDRRYASIVESTGNVSDGSLFVADEAVYAAGDAEYVHDGNDTCRRAVRGADEFVVRGERYARWLLSVNESWIFDRFERNGTTFYSVQLQGDPWYGIRNSTGSALISESGLVHAVRRVGETPDGGYVGVAFQYRKVGNTTVEAPDWYRGGDASPCEESTRLSD